MLTTADRTMIVRTTIADLARIARERHASWPVSDSQGRSYAQGQADAYEQALKLLDDYMPEN